MGATAPTPIVSAAQLAELLFVTVSRNSGESPAFASTLEGEIDIEGAFAMHTGGGATTVTLADVERDNPLVALRARRVRVRVLGA